MDDAFDRMHRAVDSNTGAVHPEFVWWSETLRQARLDSSSHAAGVASLISPTACATRASISNVNGDR